MPQPVKQQRITFLETAGEEFIMELVASGKYLSEVAEILDPGNKVGLSKPLLSSWLGGKLKRNIPHEFTDADGVTELRPPETDEQAKARGQRYAVAREQWAESVVEHAGLQLRDEDNDKMANLRKAQAEFALKIAGIFDKRYAQEKGHTVAVQVNVTSGDDHLNALRRRKVEARITQAEATPAIAGESGA